MISGIVYSQRNHYDNIDGQSINCILPVSVEEEYPYPPPDCAYNSLHAFPVLTTKTHTHAHTNTHPYSETIQKNTKKIIKKKKLRFY